MTCGLVESPGQAAILRGPRAGGAIEGWPFQGSTKGVDCEGLAKEMDYAQGKATKTPLSHRG